MFFLTPYMLSSPSNSAHNISVVVSRTRLVRSPSIMSSTTVHAPISEAKDVHLLRNLTVNLLTECFSGGVAACGATLFSNPLEVVKTRMQLQGELQARGSYNVHYRNVFHAFYMIGKNDGLLALQKGLIPGLGFQLVMNGIRLGSYQCLTTLFQK